MKITTKFIIAVLFALFILISPTLFGLDVSQKHVLITALLGFIAIFVITSDTFNKWVSEKDRKMRIKREREKEERKRLEKVKRTEESKEMGRRRGIEKYKEEQRRKKYWEKVGRGGLAGALGLHPKPKKSKR